MDHQVSLKPGIRGQFLVRNQIFCGALIDFGPIRLIVLVRRFVAKVDQRDSRFGKTHPTVNPPFRFSKFDFHGSEVTGLLYS